MGVEKAEVFEDMTVFHLRNYRRFGEPDPTWVVIIYHNEETQRKMPKIHKKLAEEIGGVEEHQIPCVGTIVWICEDTTDGDYSSCTFRAGCHDVHGPFLLVDESVSSNVKYKDGFWQIQYPR